MTPTRFTQCLMVTALVLASTPALAALPPEYQRAAEINAVMAVAMGALDGQAINSVEFVRQDLYRVTTDKCELTVEIIDLPQLTDGWVGPRQFQAVVNKPKCEDGE